YEPVEPMKRVFISYRHVKPDEDLVRALVDALSSAGFDTFVDRRITVGSDWVAEIDKEIRGASAFIVLLSQNSIASDMVREEIRLAHELLCAGKLRILPIRVAFDGPLPYDLGFCLNRLQYLTWSPPESFESVTRAIVQSLSS